MILLSEDEGFLHLARDTVTSFSRPGSGSWAHGVSSPRTQVFLHTGLISSKHTHTYRVTLAHAQHISKEHTERAGNDSGHRD